jgi:chromosome segregation ATPase
MDMIGWCLVVAVWLLLALVVYLVIRLCHEKFQVDELQEMYDDACDSGYDAWSQISCLRADLARGEANYSQQREELREANRRANHLAEQLKSSDGAYAKVYDELRMLRGKYEDVYLQACGADKQLADIAALIGQPRS